MFGKQIRLFRLLGFEVRVDASWLFLAFLVTWSLATGLFPQLITGLGTGLYWFMAVIGMVGLMLSIIIHEFCHSLVARYYGLPIHSISLFIFGGVAQMEEEPQSPKVELLMAAAGPAASLVLAVGLWVVLTVLQGNGGSPVVMAVLIYLTYLNALLAVFNMLPAFPLDGGRVLRAILWGWRGDILWASRIASRIGQGFGLALVFLGIYSILNQYVVSGFWWILIGLFLRMAAQAAYRQAEIRQSEQG